MCSVYYRGIIGVGPDVDSAIMDAVRKHKLTEHWASGELHALAVVR